MSKQKMPPSFKIPKWDTWSSLSLISTLPFPWEVIWLMNLLTNYLSFPSSEHPSLNQEHFSFNLLFPIPNVSRASIHTYFTSTHLNTMSILLLFSKHPMWPRSNVLLSFHVSLLTCFLNIDPWLRSNHQENSSYLSIGIDSSEHGKLSHLLRTELFCLYLVTMTAASMSHAAEQPLALTLKVKTVRWK